MLNIGYYNTLTVARSIPHGLILIETEGEAPLEEVLLPNKFVTDDMNEGDKLSLFVYKDSEDRPVATTQTPLATAGEMGFLTLKQITPVGAFFDIGIDKDLLVPYSEQPFRPVSGRSYPVFVYVDRASKRMAGSLNLNRFIKNREVDLETNQPVVLMACEINDLGVKVVVNNMHWGILYKSELFKPLKPGDVVEGFVKKVREDGKIDVALQKQGIQASKDLTDVILQKLEDNNGTLNVSDGSPPELIYELFETSKKNFKKAAGMLYRQGKIEISQDEIRLKK